MYLTGVAISSAKGDASKLSQGRVLLQKELQQVDVVSAGLTAALHPRSSTLHT